MAQISNDSARQDPQQLYWRDVERVAKTGEAKAAPQARQCDQPSCTEPGTHRAPKSRHGINEQVQDFHWFCLPHVQEYNKSWNYYSGLSIDEMEDVRRQDMVGWRPTWPLGQLGGKPGAGANRKDLHKDVSPEALRAHIFTQFFGSKTAPGRRGTAGAGQAAAKTDLLPEERAALQSFQLPLGANWAEIKQRYKQLALQYHPDRLASAEAISSQAATQANDEQIKLINRAYAVLKRRRERLR